MTKGHYPYAWDKEGRGIVVLDNPLGLQRKQEAQLLLGDRATRKHAKDS